MVLRCTWYLSVCINSHVWDMSWNTPVSIHSLVWDISWNPTTCSSKCKKECTTKQCERSEVMTTNISWCFLENCERSTKLCQIFQDIVSLSCVSLVWRKSQTMIKILRITKQQINVVSTKTSLKSVKDNKTLFDDTELSTILILAGHLRQTKSMPLLMQLNETVSCFLANCVKGQRSCVNNS